MRAASREEPQFWRDFVHKYISTCVDLESAKNYAKQLHADIHKATCVHLQYLKELEQGSRAVYGVLPNLWAPSEEETRIAKMGAEEWQQKVEQLTRTSDRHGMKMASVQHEMAAADEVVHQVMGQRDNPEGRALVSCLKTLTKETNPNVAGSFENLWYLWSRTPDAVIDLRLVCLDRGLILNPKIVEKVEAKIASDSRMPATAWNCTGDLEFRLLPQVADLLSRAAEQDAEAIIELMKIVSSDKMTAQADKAIFRAIEEATTEVRNKDAEPMRRRMLTNPVIACFPPPGDPKRHIYKDLIAVINSEIGEVGEVHEENHSDSDWRPCELNYRSASRHDRFEEIMDHHFSMRLQQEQSFPLLTKLMLRVVLHSMSKLHKERVALYPEFRADGHWVNRRCAADNVLSMAERRHVPALNLVRRLMVDEHWIIRWRTLLRCDKLLLVFDETEVFYEDFAKEVMLPLYMQSENDDEEPISVKQHQSDLADRLNALLRCDLPAKKRQILLMQDEYILERLGKSTRESLLRR